MKIAKKVFKQNESDNMVLDRLIKKNGYQEHYPLQIDQNHKKEETAYIFEDGSALIVNTTNDWRVDPNYGLHADHEKY